MNVLLKPLCRETERLLEPIEFWPGDRLDVSLNDKGTHFVVQAYGINNRGERGYASHVASSRWITRIPERRQDKGSYAKWELSTTDFTALILKSVWNHEHIEFTKDAKIVYEYLLQRFMSQTILAQERARFEVADSHMQKWYVKEVMSKWPYIDNADLPLAPYQMVGLRGIMYQEASALFMEQGTGKTPVVIARICNEALTCDHMYRTIIVAPKNVRANWRNEFLRFSTVPGKVTVLRGSAIDRVKLLIEATKNSTDCKWTAVVCSYETLQRSWEAMQMIQWDLAVLDESHYIKSPQTKRFKAAMKLRDHCRQRMCLTGTPITNHLLDLFAQFEFLGEGLSGFLEWRKFRTYYGRFVKRGSFTYMIGYQNLPIMQERLARLSYLIRKKDALPELPEKVNDIVEVTMTPEQLKFYVQVATQLAIECKNDLDEAGTHREMVIRNVLTKMLRLSQITAGFLTYDPVYNDYGEEIAPKTIDRLDPNPKLEALVELLKEKTQYQKTVVWSCWVQDIRTISARLKLEGIDHVTFYGATKEDDRDTAVERFNLDARCKVFVGNPAAGGTGINLHGYNVDNPDSPYRCDHNIYFSQNWSPTARSQSEDRSHRRGSRHNVRYTDLCVPNSIDEEIRVRVLQKRMSAYTIQDVRIMMQRVLLNLPQANGDS